MSEYIPLELQAEILKRLPVKPLLQFRSVSKPWKRLIDSPDFIVSYGVRLPPQPPHRFILRYQVPNEYSSSDSDDDDNDSRSIDKYLSLVDNDDDRSLGQERFIPPVPDLITTLEWLTIVGICHGLLCVHGFPKNSDSSDYGGTKMVVFWNPSIRKSVGVQVPKSISDANFGADELHDVIGFGVCPGTSDPTILKIQCVDYKMKMKDTPDISYPWEVQVFTLSTGTWSILSNNLPRGSIRLGWYQVVIDRFIYWVAFDMLNGKDGPSQSHSLIMSFDLAAKEFKEINLPDSITNRLCSILTISNLRESLVVLGYHREPEQDKSDCYLWRMEEEGVNRTFEMLHNIKMPDATIRRLLGFRKTDELILETQRYCCVGLETYDPSSEAIVDLGIGGHDYSFFMCPYMETLLLLDCLDGFIYSFPK